MTKAGKNSDHLLNSPFEIEVTDPYDENGIPEDPKTGPLMKELSNNHLSKIELPVLWGWIDFLGHLNNKIYLQLIEEGRTDYFIKWVGTTKFPKDSVMVIVKNTVSYLNEVTFPDRLVMFTRLKKLGKSSIVFETSIVSKARGVIVAKGAATVVALNEETRRSKPIPNHYRQKLLKMESKTGNLDDIEIASSSIGLKLRSKL